MLHFIKTVVGQLATPLMLAMILLVIALLLRQFGRRRAAVLLSCVAGLIVYLGAMHPVSEALLAPLENAYPPLSELPQGPIAGIVVLGSRYVAHDGIPITAAISSDGLARVAEGVRLARMRPGTRLILSGGVPPESDRVASAKGYAIFAREFGIDRASMLVLDHSMDTADEAREVAKLFGNSPFILVTSAHHMPRAVRLMRRAGANPIPAPTGQRILGERATLWESLRPTTKSLDGTDTALHEYLGLLALNMGLEK